MNNDVIEKINAGKYTEAKNILNKLIKQYPENSRIHYLMGFVNLKLLKFDDSLEYFKKSVNILPNIENLFAYADLLTRKKNFFTAEHCYKKILELDKNNEPSLINLAYIYLLLQKYDKSEKCYLKALELNNNCHYYKNLGNLYKRQNRLDDAIKYYKLGLEQDPENHDIKKGIGLVMLSQKKYENAWKYFESRIFVRQNQGPIFTLIKNNLFKKSKINEAKNLAVVSEQGIGDKILYSSLYKDLINLNINIKFIVDPRLEAIFKRSFGKYEYVWNDNFNRIKELIEDDYQFIYAGNLGKYFRRDIKDFDGKPFLVPNERKVNEYKSILKKYGFKKYIGISWKSSSKFSGYKSYKIDDFNPIIINRDFGIVNLQYGNIHDLESFNLNNEKKIIQIKNLDLFNDIDSTIALIQCLDYVVTSPNVTIHLAGSIGKSCLAFYSSNYESIFNSPIKRKNEWYKNLKIIQFHNGLKKRVKDSIGLLK